MPGKNAILFCLAAWSVIYPIDVLSEDNELPPDVSEYLSYTLGRWESKTTYFDKDGNPTREEVEGFGEEALLEGHLNLHSSYNTDGSTNKAFRFYSPTENKVYLIDVTAQGIWWILYGKPGDDVMYSQEKELSDGRKVILRITHFNQRPTSFEAIAEFSDNSGNEWRKISHQRYKKIGENPAR